MNSQPTGLLNFDCHHCATVLTVPLTMAGVTGPCPSCASPVTAPSVPSDAPLTDPTLLSAPPAPSTATAVSSKARALRPLAYAGLCAAVAGVVWSVWRFQSNSSTNVVVTNGVIPPSAVAPADPKVAALARSADAVKKFLATSDWEVAKAMIAAQDTPGTAPAAAYLPQRFQPLAASGKFTPVSVATKENAGQYQVVWQIENPLDAEKLVMTADDTPEGVRIRWYQPPYFIASQKGTNANPDKPALVAPVSPALTPAPVPAAAPEPAPEVPANQKVTILAALDLPTSPSDGSAPLNNAGAKQKPTTDGTASTSSPQPKQKAAAAPRKGF